ncbi:hypothetical protein E2C01_052215 [Portunus trituberculatus]|uniref:Uncharacterized protein n=1 Tax=Portunus trituberculatus TaxID=210409 RepID=A0A5B7GKZ6_PORTR|nr:hypothetical protein [Portunus trituberculatus]
MTSPGALGLMESLDRMTRRKIDKNIRRAIHAQQSRSSFSRYYKEM